MRQVRLAFVLLPAFLALVSAQTPPQTPPPAQGPPAGQMPPGPPGAPGGAPPPQERWKPEKLTNLKVLPKDTTPDQIMEIMNHFRRSLNMGCLGCHKGQQGQPISTFDFPDDSKENKEVARKMVKLTDDLNTKYADSYPDRDDADKSKPRVTCATCHRGKRHVDTDPPPPPPRPEGAPQGPRPPGPPL
jgi:hypothetical protein